METENQRRLSGAAQNQASVIARGGWKASYGSPLPVEGEIFFLTFPFIEQALSPPIQIAWPCCLDDWGLTIPKVFTSGRCFMKVTIPRLLVLSAVIGFTVTPQLVRSQTPDRAVQSA